MFMKKKTNNEKNSDGTLDAEEYRKELIRLFEEHRALTLKLQNNVTTLIKADRDRRTEEEDLETSLPLV